MSWRSNISSEGNSNCCYISDAWTNVETKEALSTQISILQKTSSGRLLIDSRKRSGAEMETLTHYSPMMLFHTAWKYQKTFRFSDVFRGHRKATSGCNGLRTSSINRILLWKLSIQNCTMECITKNWRN